MKIFQPKFLVFLAALCFGLVCSVPSFFDTKGPKITLGLDLQGGLQLLLGVDTDAAIAARYSSIASAIEYEAAKKQILLSPVQAQESNVQFDLIDSVEVSELEVLLKSLRGIAYEAREYRYTILLTQQEQEEVRKQAILQAITTIRNRLNEFGLAEPSVTQQGREQILVELPGRATSARSYL